jgi:hypothetical protein
MYLLLAMTACFRLALGWVSVDTSRGLLMKACGKCVVLGNGEALVYVLILQDSCLGLRRGDGDRCVSALLQSLVAVWMQYWP